MDVDIGTLKVRNPQSETFKTLSEPYTKFQEWLTLKPQYKLNNLTLSNSQNLHFDLPICKITRRSILGSDCTTDLR